MGTFASYSAPDRLYPSQAGRIGMLLGLRDKPESDVALAERVAGGLGAASAEALARLLGKAAVIGQIVPEPTLRRARKARKPLSREMSERLYEISRVLDAVSLAYRGDEAAIRRFLDHPHPLLDGKTPLELARSSSAGADAVLNLLRRAEHGFAV